MSGSGEHVRTRTRTLTSPHPARNSAGDRSSRGTRSHAALSNVSLHVTARAYATVCKGIMLIQPLQQINRFMHFLMHLYPLCY